MNNSFISIVIKDSLDILLYLVPENANCTTFLNDS